MQLNVFDARKRCLIPFLTLLTLWRFFLIVQYRESVPELCTPGGTLSTWRSDS